MLEFIMIFILCSSISFLFGVRYGAGHAYGQVKRMLERTERKDA